MAGTRPAGVSKEQWVVTGAFIVMNSATPEQLRAMIAGGRVRFVSTASKHFTGQGFSKGDLEQMFAMISRPEGRQFVTAAVASSTFPVQSTHG